ncbi:MAG: OmpA family protein [Myxococcales bacterium]|nr:OmpA family protein [Myxococcales bacterium]
MVASEGRTSTRRALFWLAAVAAVAMPVGARAQGEGFAIDRYSPAEAGSDWFAAESLDLRGQLRPAASLTLDWGHKPLVLYDANGDELAAVIEDQVFVHLGAALNLWERVRLGLSLPLQLSGGGESGNVGGTTIDATGGAHAGDLRAGLDLRLVGEYGGPATLALGVQAFFPTGSREAFTGDGKMRLSPRLMLAGDVGPLAYSARVAFNYRAQDEPLGGNPTGSELGFAASAGLRVADGRLLIGPELWGSTVVSEGDAAFSTSATPVELLLGAHYKTPTVILSLGAGPGLNRGLGAPGVRVLASVQILPAIEEPEPPPPPPAPEPPPSDRDSDGIVDTVDACPDTPGEANADPAKHGCPPPGDRDGDGIDDESDACPDTPGEASDDPEKHGCPPPDRDGDGVIDRDDACPDVPGVETGHPRTNGCPPDTDGDTILDNEDACPEVAGPPNEDKEKHGCPVARVEDKQIKITERIEFATNRARIRSESVHVVEAVLEILREHPEIERLSVEGHTDDRGKARHNKKLSQRRAASVVKWLVDHGIDRSRLSAEGFGMERPLADNETKEGRQKNRRVEFHIKQAPNGE